MNSCILPSLYINSELFPTIKNTMELKKSMWYDYIDHIYDINTIQNNYPIDIKNFSFFYTKYIPKEVLENIKDQIKKEPCIYGDFYTNLNNIFEYCDTFHVYMYPYVIPSLITNKNRPNDPPFLLDKGVCSHTWIEVIHCCCDIYLNGYWFYFAKGSGIWYNVGNTIIFNDHVQAYCYFYNKNFSKLTELEFREINGKADKANFLAGRRNGYDSIQYLYRIEFNGKNSIYKTEIQDVRHQTDSVQTFDPCPDNKLKKYIRTGWWKNKLKGKPPKCLICSKDNHCLNSINRKLKNPCPKK